METPIIDMPTGVATSIATNVNEHRGANVPTLRAIRRCYTKRLAGRDGAFVIEVARSLAGREATAWLCYELLRHHPAAFGQVDGVLLEELGKGMQGWGWVDAFGRILSGPAWLTGQVEDDTIHRWARSEDRWWRRAALVSTVALNIKTDGGEGDAGRTLAVCRMLVDDHDDMIVKALSWALRALGARKPHPVERFLAEHEKALAARVKREVRNKLRTGLKNPR